MVPSTFSRLKAARCLPVVLAALIFAGCGTHTPDQSTAYAIFLKLKIFFYLFHVHTKYVLSYHLLVPKNQLVRAMH